MSVVGIDFGNENCYISVARAGGIESIANDYSMRDTPSYVAFSEKQRIMGVAAKSQHLTNLKRTFFGFKPLIGRKFKDPQVQEELKRLPYDVSEDPKTGEVAIHVDYMGKHNVYSAKQVTAMLLTKLKETAEVALQTKVKDVVISVPCYYTDAERRCLLDAAAIADLNVLKLMNDTTATALAYGIYKQDLPAPEEKARNVVFVDVGHRGIQAAACSFNKGKLIVQACAFDSGVGGRNFNEAIARYFAEDFKTKFKIDTYSKPKAVLKLITEIEKLKKQMSANTNKLPLNIECFMDDKDVKGHIDRGLFEELIEGDLKRIEVVLQNVLAVSKWKKDDIYSVEVVGGSTRVPAIKVLIEKVFNKAPNTTLNSDESVSRGCALQCAILSPTFKVREFSVTDAQPYAIRLKWIAESDKGDMEVFPKFHPIPFSKMLTFYRRESFTVSAEYIVSSDSDAKCIADPHIGEFEISEVNPQPDGSNQKVKVKVRVNLNGVFTVSSASLIEKVEIEEEVPMEVEEKVVVENNKEGAAGKENNGNSENNEMKDDDAAAAAAAATTTTDEEPKTEDDVANPAPPPPEAQQPPQPQPPEQPPKMEKRKKIVSKTIDLPISSHVVGALTFERLQEAATLERTMANQDRMEAERLTAKNAVEEYVYDIRSRIYEDLTEFISEEDRTKFSKDLEDAENWLYEEGENCEKQVYVDKLKELKMIGEAVKKRKSEFEERPAAFNALGHALQMAQKIVDAYRAGDEKYNHLDSASVDSVSKLIEEKTTWMNESIATLNNLDKTTNPPILAVQFYNEKKSFESFANPILNKRKPKVEPPKSPPKKDKNEDVAAAAAAGAAGAQKQDKTASSSEKKDEEEGQEVVKENGEKASGDPGKPPVPMDVD